MRDSAGSNGVKSAARTLDLLECLAKSNQPLSHTELCLRTGIPKSSLTQLLRTLHSRGYVESLGQGGPFRIGKAAHALVKYGLDVQQLIASAEPAMRSLCERSGHSCGLNALNGDYVERVRGITAPAGLAMHEGVRAPLYASSSGKLFLASMSAEEREQYFSRVELRPLARRSIRSLGELHRQIESARAQGIAYSQDEFTNGVVGFSAPVLDRNGQLVAALGLAVPTGVFTEQRSTLAKLLRAHTASLVANC